MCGCVRVFILPELAKKRLNTHTYTPSLRTRFPFFFFFSGPRVIAHLESGKRVVGDALLYTMGRQGNTDTMDLAKAGLEADSRGLLEVQHNTRSVRRRCPQVSPRKPKPNTC